MVDVFFSNPCLVFIGCLRCFNGFGRRCVVRGALLMTAAGAYYYYYLLPAPSPPHVNQAKFCSQATQRLIPEGN